MANTYFFVVTVVLFLVVVGLFVMPVIVRFQSGSYGKPSSIWPFELEDIAIAILLLAFLGCMLHCYIYR